MMYRFSRMFKILSASRPALSAFLWALLIFVLCATPGRYIPSASWLDLLSFDKLVHAGIFFVLTALLMFVSFKMGLGQSIRFVYMALAILYGMAMEWMQANWFVERSADWMDVVANTLGCLLALLVLKRLKMIYSKWLAMV